MGEVDVPADILATFYALDADGNGCIEKAEMIQIMKRLSPAWDDDTVEALFVQADINLDGKIDLPEFLAWCFDNPVADEVRKALCRERMERMGSSLLAADLPWMKANVDTSSFNESVLALVRDHKLEVKAGTNTLAQAHAMLSVDPSDLPESFLLEASNGESLADTEAAPLAYAALLSGIKSVKVGKVTFGQMMYDALINGLEKTSSESFSLADAGIEEDEDMATILGAVCEGSQLQMLDISGNAFGNESLTELKEGVMTCATLKQVRLKGMKGSIGNYVKELEELRAVLAGRSGSLECDV